MQCDLITTSLYFYGEYGYLNVLQYENGKSSEIHTVIEPHKNFKFVKELLENCLKLRATNSCDVELVCFNHNFGNFENFLYYFNEKKLNKMREIGLERQKRDIEIRKYFNENGITQEYKHLKQARTFWLRKEIKELKR